MTREKITMNDFKILNCIYHTELETIFNKGDTISYFDIKPRFLDWGKMIGKIILIFASNKGVGFLIENFDKQLNCVCYLHNIKIVNIINRINYSYSSENFEIQQV